MKLDNSLPHVLLSRLSLVAIMIFIAKLGMAQSNSKSFTSLELPSAASIAALGGINVSRADLSVSYSQSNPALISDTLSGWASANHLFYFADIGFSSFSYQHAFNRVGAFNFSINHMSMGSVEGYDIFGSATGVFDAGETTLVMGKSHQVNAFRLGVNLKSVFSNIAGYRGSALLVDIGGAFVHPTKEITIGLAIKNIGFVMSEFSALSSSSLPFDVQAGITYKPEHMPVRISTTVYRLVDFNIPYLDPGLNEKPSTLDKVTSHLTFGAEVLAHKNVNILIGYNFLKHKELKLENTGGGSGVSVGALIKVKQLNFAFSRSGYVTGGSYQISLDINMNKIITRR